MVSICRNTNEDDNVNSNGNDIESDNVNHIILQYETINDGIEMKKCLEKALPACSVFFIKEKRTEKSK